MGLEKLERIENNIKEVVEGSHEDVIQVNMRPYAERLGQDAENELPYYGNRNTCPPWYKRWAMDPITFCIINGASGDILNIIKYIMRFDMKDGLKDLYKARDYLNMMIEHHYGKDKV